MLNWEKYSKIRRSLHQSPELSGKEKNTSLFVMNYLSSFPEITIHYPIGTYGIIAEFLFTATGPTLLFRADMDAVAIEEELPKNYISRHPGISHKCGHDGHTTILLGLAEMIHQCPLAKGRILLFFQSSEENGQGASAALQDPYFLKTKIHRAYALHNLPGYPLSAIVCRPGSFTSSVISCTIQITGKTAHAAEPEKAISPIPALLQILYTTEHWNCKEPTSSDYFRSTLIELHIGEKAYGVAAGEGLIRLTFRAAT